MTSLFGPKDSHFTDVGFRVVSDLVLKIPLSETVKRHHTKNRSIN